MSLADIEQSLANLNDSTLGGSSLIGDSAISGLARLSSASTAALDNDNIGLDVPAKRGRKRRTKELLEALDNEPLGNIPSSSSKVSDNGGELTNAMTANNGGSITNHVVNTASSAPTTMTAPSSSSGNSSNTNTNTFVLPSRKKISNTNIQASDILYAVLHEFEKWGFPIFTLETAGGNATGSGNIPVMTLLTTGNEAKDVERNGTSSGNILAIAWSQCLLNEENIHTLPAYSTTHDIAFGNLATLQSFPEFQQENIGRTASMVSLKLH